MKKTLRLLMILWIAALSPLYAQERQVTGKVTNDAGVANKEIKKNQNNMRFALETKSIICASY
jgi:hypothetical protein